MEDIKFLTDGSLGKLGKWLRILGFDTTCHRGKADRSFLRCAQQEDRVALSRYANLARRQYSGRLVVITHDQTERQLAEVVEKVELKVDPGKRLSRCLACNVILSDVSRQDMAGQVPEYVLSQSLQFRQCPRCRRIFWPGTHVDRMLQRIRLHNPSRRP